MTKRFVLLLAILLTLSAVAACSDRVPDSEATALAESPGGRALLTTRSSARDEIFVTVCAGDKIKAVKVTGKATDPVVENLASDMGACGETAELIELTNEVIRGGGERAERAKVALEALRDSLK